MRQLLVSLRCYHHPTRAIISLCDRLCDHSIAPHRFRAVTVPPSHSLVHLHPFLSLLPPYFHLQVDVGANSEEEGADAFSGLDSGSAMHVHAQSTISAAVRTGAGNGSTHGGGGTSGGR